MINDMREGKRMWKLTRYRQLLNETRLGALKGSHNRASVGRNLAVLRKDDSGSNPSRLSSTGGEFGGKEMRMWMDEETIDT